MMTLRAFDFFEERGRLAEVLVVGAPSSSESENSTEVEMTRYLVAWAVSPASSAAEIVQGT